VDLTEQQWQVVQAFIPKVEPRADGKGRPRVDDWRALNGIFWVMRTGAPWQDVPKRYGSGSTCYWRFHDWCATGVYEHLLKALAEDLAQRGQLDLSECFIDATFAPAKKGVRGWARPSAAKAAKSWQLQTALAFLSPFTWRVLRRMKSPLLHQPLQAVSHAFDPRA